MKRFVSITFDDGLIEGTRKAVDILDEFRLSATFYIVTGWIRPGQILWPRDRWNRGRNHGTWGDWLEIQHRGHDIGSHTVTHMNAGGKRARWFPAMLRWELTHSYFELRRNLNRAPSSISMPWNTPTERLAAEVRRVYDACRLGSGRPIANDLSSPNWHRLNSWAPDSNISAEEILHQVRSTPPGGWLILQFHSLDGEGYMPITSEKFRDILRGLTSTSNLETRSVDQVIRELGVDVARPLNHAIPSKKRICLITSESLSTNPRLVKEADALASAGYDTRVVSCQWLDWTRREDARLLTSRKWKSRIIDYSRQESPGRFWYSRLRHHLARRLVYRSSNEAILQRAAGRVVPEMLRLAASEPVDLFIGHNIAALPAAVLAARKQGAPVGFDAEDMHSGMWLTEIGPSIPDFLAQRIEQKFLPECTYVSAAAPLIAEAYARRYGIPLPTTILNVFPMMDRPKEFRAHNPTAPLTLYWFSQTIGARRGLEEVVHAIGLSGCPRIELHLRGQWQAGYQEVLQSVAVKAGLQKNQLIWHDVAAPDEMIRLSAQYDIGLALEHAVSENRDICLTNKICTYLLAGNAVIATATRGQRRLMNQVPGAGICYEIGDVESLAAQIHKWEVYRNLLEQARLCAWRFGQEQFNWDVEQKKFLEVVEGVLRDCKVK